MASDAFSLVHSEHLPAFKQICRLLFRCAMFNRAYGRTLLSLKIKPFGFDFRRIYLNVKMPTLKEPLLQQN